MGFASKVLKGSTALLVAHGGATLLSISSPSAFEQVFLAEEKEGSHSGVPGERKKNTGKLLTELYRGQKRYARMNEAYSEDCMFQNPVMELTGKTEIAKYFETALGKASPVQMNNKLEVGKDSSNRMTIKMINEYTIFGLTRVIPMTVDLEFNDEGKIVSHLERWEDKNSFPAALSVTRKINGWIFSNSA